MLNQGATKGAEVQDLVAQAEKTQARIAEQIALLQKCQSEQQGQLQALKKQQEQSKHQSTRTQHQPPVPSANQPPPPVTFAKPKTPPHLVSGTKSSASVVSEKVIGDQTIDPITNVYQPPKKRRSESPVPTDVPEQETSSSSAPASAKVKTFSEALAEIERLKGENDHQRREIKMLNIGLSNKQREVADLRAELLATPSAKPRPH